MLFPSHNNDQGLVEYAIIAVFTLVITIIPALNT